MKIKNILSATVVAALALTSVVSVFAYEAPETITVDVITSQYSADDVAEFGIELEEDQGYYNINVRFSDLGDLVRETVTVGRNEYIAGWGLSKVEVKCKAPDGKTLSLDYKNACTAPSKGDIANSSEYNGIQLAYDGASVEGFVPTTVGTINKLDDNFFSVDVIATLGATITFEPSITYQEFASSAMTGAATRVVCEPISVTLDGGDDDDDETVKATKNKDDSSADKKIDAYDIANGDSVQRVLVFTEKQTTLTDKSRFVVTSGDRTQEFGGDIWERIGDVEGAGGMKVSSVTFGLIVDANAKADDFTFSIK